jgi:hypothetical protein
MPWSLVFVIIDFVQLELYTNNFGDTKLKINYSCGVGEQKTKV